jgi:SAM-dependent methyltransferase
MTQLVAPTVLADRGELEPDCATHVAETRAFFAPRAPTWNERFVEDGPAFARAVAELHLEGGQAVLDVGCGAGRALPELQRAIGEHGLLVGIDVTLEMLVAARATSLSGRLVSGDARRLPFPAGSFDAAFAAGLVNHLPDPLAGLVELARIARPGARLCIFHPVGRAQLAEKHGRELSASDPLDPTLLPTLLAAAGWSLTSLDDGRDRYLAIADRAK